MKKQKIIMLILSILTAIFFAISGSFIYKYYSYKSQISNNVAVQGNVVLLAYEKETKKQIYFKQHNNAAGKYLRTILIQDGNFSFLDSSKNFITGINGVQATGNYHYTYRSETNLSCKQECPGIAQVVVSAGDVFIFEFGDGNE